MLEEHFVLKQRFYDIVVRTIGDQARALTRAGDHSYYTSEYHLFTDSGFFSMVVAEVVDPGELDDQTSITGSVIPPTMAIIRNRE